MVTYTKLQHKKKQEESERKVQESKKKARRSISCMFLG